MKLLKTSLIVVCLIVINSCKNDLKLNAPYKEIPSIYAVLNPQEKEQVIRINKVFLGEGDANQMAQIADSVNYPDNELEVTLERTVSGAKAPASTDNSYVITFAEKTITTDPGSFNRTQKVYYTNQRLFTNGIYELKVKNKRTGNVFTAKAAALDSIKSGIMPLNEPHYPYGLPIPPLSAYVDYVSFDGTVKFFPNTAALYQLTIRLHFYDSVPGVNYYKYVDYTLGTKYAKDVQKFAGTDVINYTFKKADFFNAMGVGLGRMNLSDNVSGRRAYKIEYLVYATTQEYIDYMQYVTPSLSIAQTKPLYSNFDNQAALGLFTFRSKYSISKEMATVFVSEFAYNSNTCKYQFVTAQGAKPGCN